MGYVVAGIIGLLVLGFVMIAHPFLLAFFLKMVGVNGVLKQMRFWIFAFSPHLLIGVMITFSSLFTWHDLVGLLMVLIAWLTIFIDILMATVFVMILIWKLVKSLITSLDL